MKQIENTVFISYRRRDISWALTVYQDLTHEGYDVFFDYTSIPSGDFEQIIISNIKARAHFVLILTPTTFDRCSEPGDWLRREIEIAIDEKRNIIPLFFDGFSFGTKNVAEKLTGKLKNVSRYNGMNVHQDYFHEAMERLRTKRLNVPLAAVLHPVSAEVREIVKGEQLAANKALSHGLKEKPAIQPKPIILTPKPAPVAMPPNKVTLSNGMEFMRVPAGKFIMGSNYGRDDEKPQHTVDIPYDYWMGRFPVTNALYNQFKEMIFSKGKENHPVIRNDWYDAKNYVKWLNEKFVSQLPKGYVFRLPSEAEWEKAARGTDERNYPWGDVWQNGLANTEEYWYSGMSGLLSKLRPDDVRTTTPVGYFSPRGDSPYGCADMAGNVYEWTRSLYKTYPYVADDGREVENPKTVALMSTRSFYKPYSYSAEGGREAENPKNLDRLTLRSSSFLSSHVSARVPIRSNPPPNNLWNNIGFRVCIAPPSKFL